MLPHNVPRAQNVQCATRFTQSQIVDAITVENDGDPFIGAQPVQYGVTVAIHALSIVKTSGG